MKECIIDTDMHVCGYVFLVLLDSVCDDDHTYDELVCVCVCVCSGDGVFMANHFDRHYCGKCARTYVYQKEGTQE